MAHSFILSAIIPRRRGGCVPRDEGDRLRDHAALGDLPDGCRRAEKNQQKFDLAIVTTHTASARILNETDAMIAEHKSFGCPEIGIGSMPPEYHGSIEGVRRFIKDFTPTLKKIKATGLRFA